MFIATKYSTKGQDNWKSCNFFDNTISWIYHNTVVVLLASEALLMGLPIWAKNISSEGVKYTLVCLGYYKG